MRMVYLAHMLTAAGLYVLRLGEWLLEATRAKTRITAKWWRGLTSSGRVAISGFNHSNKNIIFDCPYCIVYLQKLTHKERANSLSWSSRSVLGMARRHMPFISQRERVWQGMRALVGDRAP